MIVLDAAGYGPVTIAKSVSIVAPTGIYAGISVFSGDGVTVDAPGATVVLKGLTINGVGGNFGINVVHAARLRVESCTISNLTSIGIEQAAAGAETVVLDTVIRDNGGRGFSMVTDATAVFDNVRVEHNDGDGTYVSAGSVRVTATIRRSVLSHNAAAGVAAISGENTAWTRLVIEDSTVANNAGDGIFAGGISAGAVDASIRRNSVSNNALSGISAFGPSGPSTTGQVYVQAFDNTFADNSTSHVKGDGSRVTILIGGNEFSFQAPTPTFIMVNAAFPFTFQDNSGTADATPLDPANHF